MNTPPRLVCFCARQDGEGDFARQQCGNALLPLQLNAIGRQDRGDAHEILLFDVSIPQRQLECGKPFAMNADAVRQEKARRD
jgi:hypothetical protein